jgi:purine-binding chemotaxis protein CheW
VVNIKDISVGLLVDAVEEVLTITEQDIVPPPKINKGYYHKYIKGIGNVGDNVKLLLDCDKLLNDDEIENFSNIE